VLARSLLPWTPLCLGLETTGEDQSNRQLGWKVLMWAHACIQPVPNGFPQPGEPSQALQEG